MSTLEQLQGNIIKGPDETTAPQQKGSAQKGEKTSSFKEMLKESIEEVNKLQLEAEKTMEDLASGKEKDIQHAMMTLQKADLSLRTMMEVRNKLVEAYQEIMRMQV